MGRSRRGSGDDYDETTRTGSTGSDPDDVRLRGSGDIRPGEEVEVTPTGEDRVTRGTVEDVDETRREEVTVRRDVDTTPSAPEPRRDAGINEARRRFGGLDIPATLVGMLVALALLVLLSGLIGAAIGAIGYQLGLAGNQEELGIGGLIGGLIALFLSFLIGGWTAARIARYDGAKNGIMTAVWAIILIAILAALGAWIREEFNVIGNLNQATGANVRLPQFFNADAFTTEAIISGIVSLLTMLLGGWLGGLWGQRYHRRADQTIASTREGGIYGR